MQISAFDHLPPIRVAAASYALAGRLEQGQKARAGVPHGQVRLRMLLRLGAEHRRYQE